MSSSFVDLTGGMGYEFTDQIKAFAGYRYLKVDYKNDGNGFIFDIEMQGPCYVGRINSESGQYIQLSTVTI